MWQQNRRCKGVTQLELLIVVLIIAVFTALICFVVGKLMETGHQNTCESHQRQIVETMLMQAQDNDERLPTADVAWRQLRLGRAVLRCPSKGDDRNDYVYSLKVSGEPLSSFPQASAVAVIADGVHRPTASEPLPNIGYEDSDAERRHGGQLIACFLDGHAERTASVSLNAFDLYNWITGVGVTPPANATLTTNGNANGAAPNNLINGAVATSANPGWLSAGPANAWVQIDLGSRQAVSALRCWNYCQPNNNGCGVKTLCIYVDDVAQPNGTALSVAHAQGMTVSLPESIAAAGADSGVLKLPVANGGRYVTLALLDNYGGPNIGLAEVGIGVDKVSSGQ